LAEGVSQRRGRAQGENSNGRWDKVRHKEVDSMRTHTARWKKKEEKVANGTGGSSNVPASHGGSGIVCIN